MKEERERLYRDARIKFLKEMKDKTWAQELELNQLIKENKL